MDTSAPPTYPSANVAQRFTARISDLSRGGAGIAHSPDGKVVFVPFTAPGDLVEIEIISDAKSYRQGKLVRLVEPSTERVAPRCPIFGQCGGCSWQHLSYERQFQTKVAGVRYALKRLGVDLTGVNEFDERPALNPWNYRNRVQLRGFQDQLGFFAAQSHEIVAVDQCEIARKEINQVWSATREEGRSLSEPYKVEVEVTESGEIRRAWNQGHAAFGFRQVNDEQNAVLQRLVKEYVCAGFERGGDSGTEGGPAVTVAAPANFSRILYDLFGGQGNFAALFAGEDGLELFGKVFCVDVGAPDNRGDSSVPRGLAAAVKFVRSPVKPWLLREAARVAKGSGGGHVAIIDPPRTGLDRDVLAISDSLKKLGVTEIVTVGCDPDSWASDLSRFTKQGWRVERVGAVDLFAQTVHVESVARLVLSTAD